MKYIKYNILALILFIFASCEKEVDIDLRTAEPRLVIDASITEADVCKVTLTLTQGFWDQDKPKTVSGAAITLQDSKGNKETLTEINLSGKYVSTMKGVAKETYTLIIEVNGQEYEATEYLPPVVPIESIRIYKLDAGNDYHYYPCIAFNDPKGVENYYLYWLTINNKKMQKPGKEDDKNSDGKFREPILFFDKDENNKEELKAGDHVIVEMQSISKGTYDFYNSIESPGGSQNSNPKSNFSGNVLGMFKAYTSSIAEITVTEEDMK